jgi:peptidyl-prolyl cis-trans isomerase D
MKNAFASKMSYFVLTFIFLIIIASFLFSGFDKFSLGGLGKNVATVDGTPITSREYQMALSRQIEFFNQMMGGQGKGLTNKQLEEMGIKQSILNSLIQQKLILNTANDMKFVVSTDEIKTEIKNMPFFKTKDQFDVNLYRNMLQSNGYIPTQFEEIVGSDLKQKKLDDLFRSVMISENLASDISQFKNSGVSVTGVKIPRQAFSALIQVSKKEINDYLADSKNQKALDETYQENFNVYNKAAEIKARHILIQGSDDKALEKISKIRSSLSIKNFSEVANKETQDPSGSKNGGDLGWFSKGKMVPEFEKVAFELKKGEISNPVKTNFGYHIILVEDKKEALTRTLSEVKSEVAQINLQRSKSSQLDEVLKSQGQRFGQLLASNNVKEVEAIAKDLKGSFFSQSIINKFEQTLSQVPLAPQEIDKLFQSKQDEIVDFSNPGHLFVLKIVSIKQPEASTSEKLTQELNAQNAAFGRKVREELLREMNNKAKIVTNPALL